jgi:hypothetical protein
MDYVEQFICPAGCMMRDMALIDNSVRMLESQPFDSFTMYSVDPKDQTLYAHVEEFNDSVPNYYRAAEMQLLSMYGQLNHKIHKSIFDVQFNKSWGSNGYSYLQQDGNNFIDYHPTVPEYAEYLQKLGIQFSDTTMESVEEWHNMMKSVTHVDQLCQSTWPWSEHRRWPI